MTEASHSSLPNRAHYPKAVLAGGGLGALLSILPGFNTLNLFFGLLIICGGGLAAYLVQQKSARRLGLGEAIFVGMLGGLLSGAILTGISVILGVPLWLIVLDEVRRSKKDGVFFLGAMFFTGSCVAAVTVYPLLGAIGGLFSGLINHAPKHLQGTEHEGAAPAPAPPTHEELAKRSKVKKAVLASCLGCIGLTGLAFAGFTYLIYLQSRDPYDTAGYDEVASAPVTVGARGELRIPAVEDDSAIYGLWLVREAPYGSIHEIEGRLGCSGSGYLDPGESPRMRRLYLYRTPESDHPDWFYIGSEYAFRGEESTCHFEFTDPASLSGARLVAVRLTRPFD